MQKNYAILSLTTILSTSTLFLTSASAASPSPSPKPSATATSSATTAEVTESLKKRLQETLAEDNPTPALAYRSFVGVIRDVIKDTLVIEDKDGKKKIVIQDGASVVRSPGNKTIPVDSIRIDDNVISIGTLKESDELEAVRIIVSADPLTTTTKTSALARITKLTKSSVTTTTLNTGETKTILINQKTTLKSSLGESLELADLNVGDSIVYTASQAKDTLTATSLMRIGFADPDASTTPVPSPSE